MPIIAQSAAASGRLSYKGKVPTFYLPLASASAASTATVAGGQSGPAATRSKYNLVLAFVEGGPEGENYLRALFACYHDILRHVARVMAVVPLPLAEAQALAVRLALPFTLLADEGGSATRRMLGEGNHAALCVADRYGVVYFLEVSTATSALPPVQVALDWLEFIEIQCPE